MTLFSQSRLLLGALLRLSLLLGLSLETIVAAEVNAAGETQANTAVESDIAVEADIPPGYEAAAAPKPREQEQGEAELPQIAAAGADEQPAEIPVGYEDSNRATKRKKQTPRRIVVPAVPVAEAIALADKQFDDNPQLQAVAAQMREQLKPYFAAELSFAQMVCQPNAKQLKQMKAQATPELEKAIRAMALQQAPQLGSVRGVRRAQQASGDPLAGFRQAANRIVSDVFPAHTANIFHDEQQRRQEFRAEAGATALVAHLDTQFRLTVFQRKSLTDSIKREWQGVWQTYLQVMESNPQFFPPVPDQAIVPHLDAIQVKQWKARQRHQLGFHWQNLRNHGLFRNMRQEIDWFEKPRAAHAQRFRFLDLFEGVNVVIDAIEKGADEDQVK